MEKGTMILEAPVKRYFDGEYHIQLELRGYGYAYTGTSHISYEEAEKDLYNALKRNYQEL